MHVVAAGRADEPGRIARVPAVTGAERTDPANLAFADRQFRPPCRLTGSIDDAAAVHDEVVPGWLRLETDEEGGEEHCDRSARHRPEYRPQGRGLGRGTRMARGAADHAGTRMRIVREGRGCTRQDADSAGGTRMHAAGRG